MKKKFFFLATLIALASSSWAFLASEEGETTEPIDVTAKIANADFSDGTNGWSGEFGNGVIKASSINPLITAYKGTFNIYQDIEGLENGEYKLRVQAFTRPLDHNAFKEALANGETLANESYIYANDEKIRIKFIHEEYNTTGTWGADLGDGHYVPNNSNDAAYAFADGLYWNELTFIVRNGKARIGIRQDITTGAPYVGYDNFELKYYGALQSITDEQKDAILASVPTGAMNAEVKAALDKALEAFNAESNVENYNALGAAIADAETSIKAYADVNAALDAANETTLSETARAHFNEAVASIVKALEDCTLAGDGSTEIAAIAEALKAAVLEDLAGTDDRTALIVNPDFSDGTTGWKGNFGSGAVKATGINPLITAFNSTFNVYQDIEGLANGTYKLKVQAFTRPMGHNDLKTAVANGDALNNETYLYANEQETYVKLISEEYGTSGKWGQDLGGGRYLPDSSNDAAYAFGEGLYWNELIFIVKDGTARIGIRQEATTGVPYVGYDNFQLYYVSSETELPKEDEKPLTAADVLAQLKLYNKVAQQALDHADFDAIYAAAVESISGTECPNDVLLKAKTDVQAALATLLKNGETTSGQFDLTSLIVNADFKNKLEGWQTTKPFAWSSNGMAQLTGAKAAGQLSQVLENMPAGKYTLKAQGFYRQSGWKEGLYEFEHGNRHDNLCLFLNDAKKPVKSLFEDARSALASANVSRQEDVGATISGHGFPHMMSKVGPMFGAGHYWNYIEVEVAQDGDITLGADFANCEQEDNWSILDNFRLYYGTLKPIELSRTNIKVKDVTPAHVTIAKSFVGGEMTPFAAPCDIPGSLFKAVYEIGKLDYNTKTATLYPVENVRAGVPCMVVTAEDMEALEVGETVISAAVADTTQLAWEGGIIYPVFNQFTWRTIEPTKTNVRQATAYTNFEIQDLTDMDFTATIENFQIQRFLTYKYTTSSNSVVGDYNKPAPARRDLAHAIPVPVPASKSAGAVVRYSLNEDMSEAKSIDVLHGATTCYIPNLIPDNTYYFEVTQSGETAVKGKFATTGHVRMLYAPSIYNIRDFGGWTMRDGRKTRYGLIYRGGEVNGFHAPYQKDVETLKELGIGAEIDLRFNDSYDQDRETNKSGFGFIHGDSYYFAGANDYLPNDLNNAGTQARLKEEFRFMMRHLRQGKGVYFHCVFGADRTGFFAVLLQGLLGFTDNDIYHDYEFTSFAAPAGNRNKNSIEERVAVIRKLNGNNLCEKYENYWVNTVGITKEEVDEFRDIMLYDPTLVGISDIIPEEQSASDNAVKAVYTLGGTRLSASQMANRTGVYVVQYNNGTTRKVMTK